MKYPHLLLGLAGIFCLRCAPPTELPEASPPISPENIIVFLVDDLGWTDLGSYGSDLYETPNIDRLVQEGVKFTNAYSACTVCSPTRAALMTGKYPARLNLTDWIAGHVNEYGKLQVPDWTQYLPTEETTLAELAKEVGYATASVGKWHLGNDSTYYPQYQGFDLNVAGYYRGQPPSYFYPYVRGTDTLPYLKGGQEGEYLTDRLTEEAGRFISQYQDQPFLLYFPHYAVHTPIQAQDSLTAYYQQKHKPGMKHFNPEYAAMIHSTDASLGHLMHLLDSLSLSEQTTIIFTSDNGGLSFRGKVTNNAPLRAGKGSSYEGGVRVPMIIKRPKFAIPGTVSDEPVITMDVFATVADLLAATTETTMTRQEDGFSLLDMLQDTATVLERDALFWHYPHYHPGGAHPYSAVRQNNFKLIEFLEDNQLELYDLAEDIGETNNLVETLPEITNELYNRLEAWRAEVGAQMPTSQSGVRFVAGAKLLCILIVSIFINQYVTYVTLSKMDFVGCGGARCLLHSSGRGRCQLLVGPDCRSHSGVAQRHTPPHPSGAYHTNHCPYARSFSAGHQRPHHSTHRCAHRWLQR